MMIHELYGRAGNLHGHMCPGLAIGVRAAAEAKRIMNVGDEDRLYCIAESRACYIDGIQSVFGTTWGNGRLEVRERGKTAFNFYDRTTGKSVRLIGTDWPEGLKKSEMIEFLLSAPADRVFTITEVHFPLPPDVSRKSRKRKCSRCGESCQEEYLIMLENEAVCADCAEKEDAGR